ncbi:hypothetical protein [Xanthomarina gelatinilytica]|jgi:hypothetical protein|uniref:hypothetical protein n=1 Tax=Xanthomarina gelatinilytica TaxID=1137281 RepID=UPI003AA9A421
MIHSKFLFLEQELKKDSLKNRDSLTALYALKSLLGQIDFTAEVIPLENVKRLIKIFESLKNESLTKKEKIIVRQLVKY